MSNTLNVDKEPEVVDRWLQAIDAAFLHQIRSDENFRDLYIKKAAEISSNGLPVIVIGYHDRHSNQNHLVNVEIKMIGFSGKAGSGKDFTADIYQKILYELIEERENSSTRHLIHRDAFANTLKDICHDLTLTPRKTFDSPEGKQEQNLLVGMTNRKLAQLVGTECFRDVLGPDIWVVTVLNKIARRALGWQKHMFSPMAWCGFAPTFDKVRIHGIVADTRFDNEAQMIRALNGTIVRVVRDDHENPAEVDSHRSEQLFDLVDEDVVIHNDGISVDTLTDELLSKFSTDSDVGLSHTTNIPSSMGSNRVH